MTDAKTKKRVVQNDDDDDVVGVNGSYKINQSPHRNQQDCTLGGIIMEDAAAAAAGSSANKKDKAAERNKFKTNKLQIKPLFYSTLQLQPDAKLSIPLQQQANTYDEEDAAATDQKVVDRITAPLALHLPSSNDITGNRIAYCSCHDPFCFEKNYVIQPGPLDDAASASSRSALFSCIIQGAFTYLKSSNSQILGISLALMLRGGFKTTGNTTPTCHASGNIEYVVYLQGGNLSNFVQTKFKQVVAAHDGSTEREVKFVNTYTQEDAGMHSSERHTAVLPSADLKGHLDSLLSRFGLESLLVVTLRTNPIIMHASQSSWLGNFRTAVTSHLACAPEPRLFMKLVNGVGKYVLIRCGNTCIGILYEIANVYTTLQPARTPWICGRGTTAFHSTCDIGWIATGAVPEISTLRL